MKKTYSMSKRKRYDLFKDAINLMNEWDVPLGAAMCKLKKGYWPARQKFLNGSSPYMQVCDYQPGGGTNWCISPCNGDC